MTTFDRLITPMPRSQFLSAHWTRQGVHIPAAGRRFDDVFGWSALNSLLDAHDLSFPQVKMSRSEEPVAVEKFTAEVGGRRLVNLSALMDLFREGASFGITGADSRWPPLRGIIDALYDVFLESVHTNVYCSPANTQGFQCHFDLHEVFVLQIAGEKHWKVFWPTVDAPIESWRAEDAPAGAIPYIDVVLAPGDVLYVPRGHWHYAVARESASLHVTVGVTCRKAAAFVDWLSGELSKRPEWRRNVPLIESKAETAPSAAFVGWVGQLKESMVAALADPAIGERFWRALFDDIRPHQRADLMLQAALDDAPLDDVVFERPAGRRHFIVQQGDAVIVSAGGCDIELEAADRRILEQIFEAESFSIGDLRNARPEVSAEDLRELLRALVRSGLLVPRPTRLAPQSAAR